MEEMKMINETKKIFDDEELKVAATCVRIPVIFGHSESIYIETKEPFEIEDVKQLLANSPGILLVDNPENRITRLQQRQQGKKRYLSVV